MAVWAQGCMSMEACGSLKIWGWGGIVVGLEVEVSSGSHGY